MVEISPLLFYLHYKMIGGIAMKITKQYPNNVVVTITYNNEPSSDALKHYAHKMKEIVDNKNLIDSKKQLE